jgi:hypothetical protein
MNNWQQTNKPRQPIRDTLVKQERAIKELSQAEVAERDQRIDQILNRIRQRLTK